MSNRTKTDEPEIELDQEEEESVQQNASLATPVLYEIIRRSGEEELTRPVQSLVISGFAAGLAIGFSVLAEAILLARLPDTAWRPLIDNLGYSVGFVMVIMARLQLFTENTITVVLPVLLKPSRLGFAGVARLWSSVLAANFAGCALFAAGLYYTGAIPPEVLTASLSISHHMMENSVWQMFIKGIFAGWLIAALVWMLPNAHSAGLWLIILITYLIAAGDFTHVVAGTVEGFLLVYAGDVSLIAMLGGFFLPTLLGNVVGGTGLFALLTYGQIEQELHQKTTSIDKMFGKQKK